MSSVDVIVPCYRYGHFLEECVRSVLTQTGPDVRILILDDASPDHTAEVGAKLAAADERVTFRRHSVNQGHIATYNEGIEWVSGDYMVLLSADDCLLPGALRRAVDVLDAHPELGFVFGKVVERDSSYSAASVGEPGAFSTTVRILTGLEFIQLSGPTNIVRTPSVLVRTSLQKQLGGYSPALPHSGDMEMWLRFAAYASVGVLSSYQALYRRHAANMSLAYMDRGWMPDLTQRKAAFDAFFEAHGHRLPDADALRGRLMYSLATCALGFASRMFNEGQLDSCTELIGLASDISPRIHGSWPWLKLACKRTLGFKAWSLLRPALNRMGVAA
jgi:hypothetical protein